MIIEEFYGLVIDAIERHCGDMPELLRQEVWSLVQMNLTDEPLGSGSLIPITEKETEDDGA